MSEPGPNSVREAQVPPVLKYSGMGLAIVAAVVAIAFFANRGSQVRLNGEVLKVRTIKTDDNASIAVVEFRFNNPAKVDFLVKEAKLIVTTADGAEHDVDPVAEADLDRVLDYYKLSGPRYNPTLKRRERFAGSTTADRTIAGSFEIPESALQSRRALTIRIQDADGVVVTIPEKR